MILLGSICFLLLSSSAGAQSLLRFQFDQELPQDLTKIFHTVTQRKYRDSSKLTVTLAQLRTRMITQGYPEFSIDSLSWTDSLVQAWVHTGPAYRVGKIQLDGESYLDAGSVMDAGVIRERLNAWVSEHENDGYPFAAARLDSVKMVDHQLHAKVKLDPGPRVIIDSILNRTQLPLSDRVLMRLIGIEVDSDYSEEKIRQIDERLAATDFIQQRRLPEVGFFDGKAWVFIYPEKAHANRFDAWVGLSSGAGQGAFNFMGSLDLSLHNIIRQAESWDLHWNRNQDASQRVRFSTVLPYLFGTPFGVAGELNLFRQDTSFMNVNFKMGVPYRFSPRHTISLHAKYRESIILSGSGMNAFRLWMTGMEWQYERWDRRLNPSRGFSIIANAYTGRKSGQETDNGRQLEYGIEAQGAIPVWKDLLGFFSFRSAWRLAPIYLPNEQFRLGGVHSLRGFDEDAFRADEYMTGSLELRYRLSDLSYLVVFGDAGLLLTRLMEEPVTTRPLGFGVGAQISTTAGLFRIFYGLGAVEGTPFLLSSGKVHIGYVGLF